MRLTERDRELLRWINGHGFVTTRQAARWMGNRHQTAHRRLALLVRGGLLTQERVYHNGDGAYRLTNLGLALADDSLSRLSAISKGGFDHTVMMVDIGLAAVEETGGNFVPERRVRQQRGLNGVGVRGHVPDGLLEIDGHKPIPVELEMSTKGGDRLQRIVRAYARDRDVNEVWYFVTSGEMRSLIERITKGYGIFQIRDWEPSS